MSPADRPRGMHEFRAVTLTLIAFWCGVVLLVKWWCTS